MARKESPGSPARLTIEDIKPKGPRDIRRVPWLGTDREVGLMQLSCAELLDAHVAARDYFRKRAVPADMWSANELEKEEMVHQCSLMLVDPDDRTGASKIFKNADEARQRLTHVERAFWMAHHEISFGERAQGLNLDVMLNPEAEGDRDA
jgi:hypothetical protein